MIDNIFFELYNVVLHRKNKIISIQEYLDQIHHLENKMNCKQISLDEIIDLESDDFFNYLIERFYVDVEAYKYKYEIGEISYELYKTTVMDLAIDTSSFNLIEPIKYLFENNFISNEKEIDQDLLESCVDNKNYKVIKYLFDNNVSLSSVYDMFENLSDYHSLYIISLFSFNNTELKMELDSLLSHIKDSI